VDLNPPEVKTLIHEAVEHAYRQEYDASLEAAQRLIAEYPDNPAGYFFSGTLWELRMFDDVSDSLQPIFMQCMQQTQDKGTAILSHEDNAWAHFYIGAAHTYRAMYFGWDNNHWQCLQWGLKGPSELQKALALDSTINDARLCLGVNEYFRYTADRYLGGLGIFGSYDHSRELVEQAIHRQGYLNTAAKYALAWMYTHEEQYEDAVRLLNDLLTDYPDNRMFRKLLRDTYLAAQEYDSCLAVAGGLGTQLARFQCDNVGARAENYLAQAKCYEALDDTAETRSYCDSIIDQSDCQGKVPYLENYVHEAAEIRSGLSH
jgi:tetratricopeptide (TPR) repeat protein